MSRRVRPFLAIVGHFVVGAMLFGGVAGVAHFPGLPLAGAAFGVLAASVPAPAAFGAPLHDLNDDDLCRPGAAN